MSNERSERLWQELDALRELKRHSSIFDFEFENEPPDQFVAIFRGKGFQREADSSLSSDRRGPDKEFIELHRIQIQMPYLYPERAPDLRWVTPIFHPNVSNSGFVELEELGLSWDEKLTIDVICERLWDTIRCAHVDLENTSEFHAAEWYQNQCAYKLPLDARPLRDRQVATQCNIVQYKRRGKSPRRPRTAVGRIARDVLVIDDDGSVVEKPDDSVQSKRPDSKPSTTQEEFRIGDSASKDSSDKNLGASENRSDAQVSKSDDGITFID